MGRREKGEGESQKGPEGARWEERRGNGEWESDKRIFFDFCRIPDR
jgi:hypothetical protein